MAKSKMMFAVIERVAPDGIWIINGGISHWVFKTITEAIDFRDKMNQITESDFTYVILELIVR